MICCDLIAVCRTLTDAAVHHPTGSPQHQAHLRRAASSVYYALFHSLLQNNADMLLGASAGVPPSTEWTTVYRTLSHDRAQSKMRQAITMKFPHAITNLQALLETLYLNRLSADYDPSSTFTLATISNHIEQADAAIIDFLSAPEAQRRLLAVHLLFNPR